MNVFFILKNIYLSASLVVLTVVPFILSFVYNDKAGVQFNYFGQKSQRYELLVSIELV